MSLTDFRVARCLDSSYADVILHSPSTNNEPMDRTSNGWKKNLFLGTAEFCPKNIYFFTMSQRPFSIFLSSTFKCYSTWHVICNICLVNKTSNEAVS